MPATEWRSAPRNWTTTLMFLLTAGAAAVMIPWYAVVHGFSYQAWVCFALVLSANELSITCGYHRLFAHATYRAHPALKAVFLVLGAMTLQNTALLWSAGHRAHHRFIDDPERDPYCARRGFWFSHIGWMLHDYPSGVPDLSSVPDLQRDPLVMWQHRNYLALALGTNIGVPLLLGWAVGDIAGTCLLAGLLRLVVSHHLTFFINSLAHILGRQPYTDANTSRDNAVVALLTFGEGYHNFHHMFANDYRNGVRWWQWDPSKWFIRAMSACGLATDLKAVPWFRIQRAKLETQFRRAERELDRQSGRAQLAQFRQRLADEWATFQDAVRKWTVLRDQWRGDRPSEVAAPWERLILRSRIKELEDSLRRQYGRIKALRSQLA